MSDIPIKEILSFRDERNWQQFHNPKDLAISITLEASELLECFQWSKEDLCVDAKKEAMADELADIFIYAISFADAIGVDINTIIKKKLEKNGKKYKIEDSYGSSKKYTELGKKG